MIIAGQLKAARMLIGWSQADLAVAAGLSLATVKRVELSRGEIHAHMRTVLRIVEAFQEAGIIFLAADEELGPGVRLKRATTGQ